MWYQVILVKIIKIRMRTISITISSCLSDTNPPFSHFGLVALGAHQLVHYWVQLGHDGLAVKAGFPAADTVEVYDSWYGLPHNPYKKDTDLVRREAKEADLVIGY